MTDELKKAVYAVGNGGMVAAFYRLSVWVFCSLIAVVAFFAKGTLDRIEVNQTTFITSIAENKIDIRSNTKDIQALIDRTRDRYTKAEHDTYASSQDKRDAAQDADRARIERRMDQEIRSLSSNR